MMYGGGKSDPVIVAAKPANKAEASAAEPGEPRTGTKGNAGQQSTCQAQDWESVSQALRRRMHQSIPEQGKWLKQVATGYFVYHAVPTNSAALVTFRDEIIARWRWVLHRRSQKSALTWIRMKKLADDWLPKPRILHPWPNQRFAVKHPR